MNYEHEQRGSDDPAGLSAQLTHADAQTGPRSRPVIRVLPPAAVARIAAGEIIERPASVVKELVENALDAGARTVRVDVRAAGLTLIRVGDDGTGIPVSDLCLACERHATSKLASDDLSKVQTLGFRGEALPSIASVAELTIVSAGNEGGIGRRLTLRHGRVVIDEPAPRPRGTTVTVRHLFSSVPARLAAAGRAQTEIAQIGQMVRRLALAAPTVRFSLHIDDRLVLQTTGSNELESTINEVYGASLADNMLSLGPLEVAGARVTGVVSGAEVTRSGRGQVNVVINGRWVQPQGLIALLEAAYRPVLPRGRHPVLVLVIEAPPETVDINMHPAKLEVRLLEERAIGTACGELIRAALGQRPIMLRERLAMGLAALRSPISLAETRNEYDEEAPIVTSGLPELRLIGQVQGRLLMLEGSAGLYLIDQHRAHERILYERLIATHGGSAPEPVALPEPLLLELRPAQVARFSRRLDDLAALGFECEVFCGRTFLLRAAPVLPGVVHSEMLHGLGEPAELLPTLLGLAGDDGEGEGWRERLLVSLACRTAVRRGRPLDRSEMRALVEGLGRTGAPAVCPHGSPLLMHVSETLLEREFGWV
ncbi:MAG: DNA mismatch repair endonuclease MutL [Chloroflexota bacterium]|nr:DNA mismatch repair endonuclease MutL [Chloroflexota bacterium]